MEIYLIRHTTPDIAKGICYGQSDIGVTPTFETEVEQIHQQIPMSTISKVYTSPLIRCKRLADSFALPVIQDNRLKEINFGKWELSNWNDIPKEEITPWMDNFVTIAPPNGESYAMLQKRVLAFYADLPLDTNEKIIVVSHAGPIRSLLAHLRNIALKDSFSIPVAYGEVFKI